MSPAKQKSKDRQAARDKKAMARQAVNGGSVTSAYNPLSGTFHMLESVTADTGAGYVNGRFKTIDDVDDNASSNGGGTELECMSNNGSCSGESEDLKDKHGGGKTVGSDKREKIRGKNEKKHQRQKEKRAQELRDKCTSYLMSRKLEALSQQLVAMGFSQERSTMALILNDGHVERSVAWLLEGCENHVNEDWNVGNNPKIDISAELAKITEIEKKFKLARSDIERAVVSCEGDLDKAITSFQARSRNSSPIRDANPKDPTLHVKDETPPPQIRPALNEKGGLEPRNIVASQPLNQGRLQSNSTQPYSTLESKKLPDLFTDMQNWPGPAEIQRYNQGTRVTAPSLKMSSSQLSQTTLASSTDNRHAFTAPDSKFSNIANGDSIFGTLSNDPIVKPRPPVMLTSTQPTMSFTTRPVSPSSWGQNVMDIRPPSSLVNVTIANGDSKLNMIRTSMRTSDSLAFRAPDYQPRFTAASIPQESQSPQWDSSVIDGLPTELPVRHSRSSSGSSYGLFTGWGAGMSHPSVDWSTGPSPNFDYRTIDWSMNTSPTVAQGLSSSFNNLKLQERDNHHWDDRGFHAGMGSVHFSRNTTNGLGTWSSADSSGVALQDKFSNGSATTTREWTSPFAGKDIFNLPQAVPSASL